MGKSNEEFNKECLEQSNHYSDELRAFFSDDLNSINEHLNERKSSIYDALHEAYALGSEQPRLGSYLNDKYDTGIFADHVSYITLYRALGGPDVRHFVGSGGEVLGRYSYGDTNRIENFGYAADSQLFEFANNESLGLGYDLSKNEFLWDEDDDEIAFKERFDVESFKDWIANQLDSFKDDFPSVDVSTLASLLEDNDYDLEETCRAVIEGDEFHAFIRSDSAGPETGFEMKVDQHVLERDFDKLRMTLTKISMNSDFEDISSHFNIDESKLTGLDIEMLADDFEQRFNPRSKVRLNARP